MERLTKRRIDDGEAYLACAELRKDECDGQCTICWRAGEAVDKLAAYEDTEFSTDASIKLAAQALGTTPERLRELAEADKDGRVVVLPCKVGDTVWITGSVRRLYSEKVRTFFCGDPSYGRGEAGNNVQMIRTTGCDIPIHKFNKTVFLTREEAEKAMKGETEK